MGFVKECWPFVVPFLGLSLVLLMMGHLRWAALSADSAGIGLLAVGTPPLEVSASHYSADELYKARHTCDLVRSDDVILNLDLRQCGLGGASCGPGTLPQYLVEPGTYTFRVRQVALPLHERARIARERVG